MYVGSRHITVHAFFQLTCHNDQCDFIMSTLFDRTIARGRGRSSPLRFTPHTLAAHRFWPWFWVSGLARPPCGQRQRAPTRNRVKLAPAAALRSHRAYELCQDSVSQSVSSRPPRAHSTTVSPDGCQDSRLTHSMPHERIFVMLTKYR